MDNDAEIIALSAETLAIQTLLAHVLERIAKVDPQLDSAVRMGFDDAANEVEHFAIKFGKTAHAGHTVKALAIIEALRTATFGNPKSRALAFKSLGLSFCFDTLLHSRLILQRLWRRL